MPPESDLGEPLKSLEYFTIRVDLNHPPDIVLRNTDWVRLAVPDDLDEGRADLCIRIELPFEPRWANVDQNSPRDKALEAARVVGTGLWGEKRRSLCRRRPSASERVAPGIVLGSELASSLRATVGEEIQLISMDGEVGPMGIRPKSRTFRVVGIFETGMYEFDLKLAFIERSVSASYFEIGGTFNRMEIQVHDPASPEDPLPHRLRTSWASGERWPTGSP